MVSGALMQARRKLDPELKSQGAQRLEEGLKKRIVGQDEAIDAVVGIYQTYMAGLTQPGRPVGNLLFLGPTGSGKTRVVEAVSEVLCGERMILKVDCGEMQHSHEIAKLVGSPPGYLGHRETPPLLTQEILNRSLEKAQISFVLFDEVEKAHEALWNLLLGIMDKAILSLGDNRRVDFQKALVFMTSNLGGREITTALGTRFGFVSPLESPEIEKIGEGAARKRFSPEFMNRLDKVVVFKPLGHEELQRVLDIEIGVLQKRILDSPVIFVLGLSEEAKELILKEGTDPRYGARFLKRAIDRLVTQPLARLVATGQIRTGERIRAGVVEEKMEFLGE